MKVEVYCDESRPELLVNQPDESTYLVIGALKVEASSRSMIKKEFKILSEAFNCHGEAKWGRISNSKIDFYKALIRLFVLESCLSFRCVVVDASQVNLEKYHDNNPELAFYKFYYQVFNHQLSSQNEYTFFFDEKTSHDPTRLRELRRIIGNVAGNTVSAIHPVHSNQSVLIQMADILTGCVQAKFNSINKGLPLSMPKTEVIQYLEERLGKQLRPTSLYENKFNIFKMWGDK